MPIDEGAKPEDDEEIQVGKRSRALPMVLGALGVFVVGVGGGWAVSLLMAPSDPAGDEGSRTSENADNAAGSHDVNTKMTTLGNFTVNLRDSSGGRVLQMEIQVETTLETAAKVEERMPHMRDSVILLASDYSYSELEGIDGKLRLRDEVHARVNAVLAPQVVDRVFFTAFVVQ